MMIRLKLHPPNFQGGIIFLLVLTLILGSALNLQSCSDDIVHSNDVERELAVSSFKMDVLKSLPEIEKLVENKNSGLNKKDVELQFQNAMRPAIASSKRLLLTYGISPDYLERQFGSPNDPRIIAAGLIFAGIPDNGYQQNMAFLIPKFEAPKWLAQLQEDDGPDWFDCAIRAVGIDAVMEMLNGRITESIAKKAIKKIASRTLGWIGAAIATYEFAKCMGWV